MKYILRSFFRGFIRNDGITNPVSGKMGVTMDGNSSEIIEVVKNFHFRSVVHPIIPLATANGWFSSYCLVKLQNLGFDNLRLTIQNIKSVTSQLSPLFPGEVNFFDPVIENIYQSELQFRRTFSLFAGCAVVICCIGILVMLNRDFVKWVAIAFVIVTPLAWYAMNKWLENFAYKTSLSW